jgi:phage shock protein A
MKLPRIVGLIVLAVVAVGLVWRLAPGCRQQAQEAYSKYGGWTEKARRADPVGFIDYAENKLTADLDALTQARAGLNDATVKLSDELTRNQDLLKTAEKLAGEFRDAYRSAEASGAWPVKVADRTYSRDEMLEQVRLVLLQRDNYKQTIAELQSAAQAAKDKQQQLAVQFNTTRAALESLPAKREIARVNQLTASTEELMTQVNGLLQENAQALSNSPVRTVEEITREQQAAAPGQKDIDAQVKAFLESGE